MSAIVNRQELWHPLTVHVPIVFLLSATLLAIVLLFFKKGQWYMFLTYTLIFLLTVGTAFLWLSFYTGNKAYSPVVRTLCFPSVLKTHLYWAYITCYGFTATAIIAVLGLLTGWLRKKWLLIIVTAASIGASVCLCYTGHLGATLVYEHGAGVRSTAKDCAE